MDKQSETTPSLMLLWLVGIFQPVSPSELYKIMGQYLEDYEGILTLKDIEFICEQYTDMKCFVRVHRKPNLYSLTAHGNMVLPVKARLSRDKIRFHLLNESRYDSITKSCGSDYNRLGDDVSSLLERLEVKESESKWFASFVPTGQTTWTRFSEQYSLTGKLSGSQDTSFPNYLSFYQWQQFLVAKGVGKNSKNPASEILLDISSISLMLGVSSSLIGSILKHKDRYYKPFTIDKKSGGIRKITAPRVFLKVIQRFLLDYYLAALRTHPCVYSFTKSKSIVDNADRHTKKKFVGTIDIENYFGSITEKHLVDLLQENGYAKSESDLVAKLCTKDGVLPQGAPTSPMLSNALLFHFDEEMSKYANDSKLTYSRYADDLTISGDDRGKVEEALKKIERELHEKYSFKINESKRRIVSFNGRQIVTGLVVNEKAQLPREKRRQIRYDFYHASKKESITTKTLDKLRGHYGYLHSIPENKNKKEMKKYKSLLTKLAKRVSD